MAMDMNVYIALHYVTFQYSNKSQGAIPSLYQTQASMVGGHMVQDANTIVHGIL